MSTTNEYKMKPSRTYVYFNDVPHELVTKTTLYAGGIKTELKYIPAPLVKAEPTKEGK